MDALVNDNGKLFEACGLWLAKHVPPLAEILGATCELYWADPDHLQDHKGDHRRVNRQARMVFCYIAYRWSGQSPYDIAQYICQCPWYPEKCTRIIERKLGENQPNLREDLDLVMVRLVERMLMRRRW